MSAYDIGPDDPLAPDVGALLQTHLDFAIEVTPPGHVHALDPSGLVADDITFYSVRSKGALLAIGALRQLDPTHVEIKSMHTASAARGRGIGRAMLDHLIAEAEARGAKRVSLETGTMDAFAAARRLYESAGFERCAPFGDYVPVPNSVCMTRHLP